MLVPDGGGTGEYRVGALLSFECRVLFFEPELGASGSRDQSIVLCVGTGRSDGITQTVAQTDVTRVSLLIKGTVSLGIKGATEKG